MVVLLACYLAVGAAGGGELPRYCYLRPAGQTRYQVFLLSPSGAAPRPVWEEFSCDDYSLSPRGDFLAYTENLRVKLVNLRTGEMRQLPQIVVGRRRLTVRRTLLWSDDGKRLAVSGYDEQTRRGRLFCVEPEAMSVVELRTEVAEPTFFWSADGAWLYFVNRAEATGGAQARVELRRARYDGAGEQSISGLRNVRFAVPEEAGGRVVFAAYPHGASSAAGTSLYVFDSATGQVWRAPEIVNPKRASISPDGRCLAALAEGGVYLWPIGGEKPQPLCQGEGLVSFAWSKTGRWLAVRAVQTKGRRAESAQGPRALVALVDTNAAGAQPRVLFQGENCLPAVFSDDEAFVAFPCQAAGAGWEIAVFRTQTGQAMAHIATGEVRSIAFRPGGHELLALTRAAPGARFYPGIWPGTGSALRPVSAGLPAEYVGWSKDGQAIFLSLLMREHRGTRMFAIYAASLSGGPARRISGSLQVLTRGDVRDDGMVPVVAQTQMEYRELLVGRVGEEAVPVSGKLDVRMPAWSPDGSKLAFCYEVFAGRYATYVFDGQENKVFLVSGKILSCAQPVWLSDSSGLLIALGEPTRCALYRCAEQGEPKLFTPRGMLVSLPLEFSPDGQAFCATAAQAGAKGAGVYLFFVDGSAPRRVHDRPGYALWSPDGKWLAILEAGLRGPWGRMWLVSADGRQRVKVSDQARDAVFGPDGALIAIERVGPAPAAGSRGAGERLAERAVIVRPGAGRPEVLAEHASFAQWSPQGTMIALGPAPSAPRLTLRIVRPTGELVAEVPWPNEVSKSPADAANMLSLPLPELAALRLPREPVEWVQWAPSGNYVAFCAIGENLRREVFVADTKGRAARLSGEYDIAQMRWLAGEDRLVLRSANGAPSGGNLFVLKPAGATLAPIVPDKFARTFSVLPGAAIAFEAAGGEGTGTWLITREGKLLPVADYSVSWAAEAAGPPRHLRPPDPRYMRAGPDLLRLLR